MSNVQPVYPGGLFTWTDRVDGLNIDFANDVNSIASDLISVENIIGINPNIENSPPSGGLKITYPTISSRITDAINNTQMPACSVTSSQFIINNADIAVLNPYRVNFDPFKMFNGTDVTIPANGWYLVSTTQWWSWWNDGFSHHFVTLNGTDNTIDEDLIDWTFAGNVSSNDPNAVPRWQKFGRRPRATRIFWQGLLHKGDRLSVMSENGTTNSQHVVSNLTLKVVMLRKTTGSFSSG